MSVFSEPVLEKKLSELNCSQQSVQQLSLWLIHHRKHFQIIIKTWFRELMRVHRDKKLTFLYLANDVVQNSKKRHPEIASEFGTVMKKVMEHLAVLTLDEKTVQSIGRLLGIWKDRSIFDLKIQTDLTRIWATKSLESKDDMESASPAAKRMKKVESPKKKVRVKFDKASSDDEDHDAAVDAHLNEALLSHGGGDGSAADQSASSDLLQSLLSPSNSPTSSTVAAANNADPPDPEELIQALQELENAASSDAEVRDKISKFPTEVSEVTQLDKIRSPEEGRALMQKVVEASQILNLYNDRLAKELAERKRVGKMIADFLAAQKDLEQIAEGRLEEFRDKLDKVNAVRDDLKSHIQSLPDLTKLPDVTTGGLAPLPSAGDLFTK